MNKYHPVCAQCEKPCGLRDQITGAAWNMGDHWLCNAHRYAEVQKRSQERSKERRALSPDIIIVPE